MTLTAQHINHLVFRCKIRIEWNSIHSSSSVKLFTAFSLFVVYVVRVIFSMANYVGQKFKMPFIYGSVECKVSISSSSQRDWVFACLRIMTNIRMKRVVLNYPKSKKRLQFRNIQKRVNFEKSSLVLCSGNKRLFVLCTVYPKKWCWNFYSSI